MLSAIDGLVAVHNHKEHTMARNISSDGKTLIIDDASDIFIGDILLCQGTDNYLIVLRYHADDGFDVFNNRTGVITSIYFEQCSVAGSQVGFNGKLFCLLNSQDEDVQNDLQN